jgi:hypothetical protein
MGHKYDVEAHSPHRCTQSEGLPKGVTLGKRAMRAVENRLTRHPELPNWDILIQPASTS